MEKDLRKIFSIEDIVLEENDLIQIKGGTGTGCGAGCGVGCGAGCGSGCTGCAPKKLEAAV